MRNGEIRIPEKILAHIETARPYTIFHAGLIGIAGAEVGSLGQVDFGRALLAGCVTMCGWVAGLYVSDYHDRDIDAGSKPARPIPSGRISPLEALATATILVAIGYYLAFILSPDNLIMAIITTILGVAYSRIFKEKAFWGNFDRGLLGVCAVLFGSLASGNFLSSGIILLSLMVFFHDSATNLVGTIRDVEGDRSAGCSTVPVVYGVEQSVDIACELALCGYIFGAALMAQSNPAILPLLLFLLAFLLAVYVYASIWKIRKFLGRGDALEAHKYLVVERLILISSIIAIFAQPWVALTLLLVTLSASIASQILLRDRHEIQQLSNTRTQNTYFKM